MKLLHLFEELTMLDEAKTDRYFQMFSGIFNLLDQIDQLAVAHTQKLATATGISKEAAQVYSDTMGTELKQSIQEQVNWAVNVLGRADRITWWLRWYKIWVLSQLASWDDLERSDAFPPELSQKLTRGLQKDVIKMQTIMAKYPAQLDAAEKTLQERVNKLQVRTRTAAGADTTEIDKLNNRINVIRKIKKYQNPTSDISVGIAPLVVGPQDLLGPGGVGQKQPDLQHFMQMASMDQGIRNLRFENQTPSGLNAELELLEDEWRARMGRFIGQEDVPEGAEVLIKFPDGSHWIDLNQRSCDKEAQAMGHCGNVNWGGSHDNVLSYREPDVHPETGGPGWIPRLTFILDKSDGYLGEMKGYKNQKPSSAYHDKIVELLKLPIISGIKGGGHAPENNFSMADLDPDVAEALMDEKPELATLTYAYEKNDREMSADILEKVNLLLDEHGIAEMDEYDGKTDSIIIHDDAGDSESTYDGYSPHNYDSDFYGDDSDYVPGIVEALDDDTITGLKHYVIEVYNVLPESKISFDVSTQDKLSVEDVMEWDNEDLFSFLGEEQDDVYDVLSDAIKESYKGMYESNIEYAIESAREYGHEESFGDIRKRDDGNWQVYIDVDEFMDQLVPRIESGEQDNKQWYSILNMYMDDVGESMSMNMSEDNDWMFSHSAEIFEENETVKQAISLGMTGVPDPDNEFQQELDFGELQIPPKPEQPKWEDYKDEENPEEYSDDIEKFRRDLKKWTNLVRKYGGEEHASA